MSLRNEIGGNRLDDAAFMALAIFIGIQNNFHILAVRAVTRFDGRSTR